MRARYLVSVAATALAACGAPSYVYTPQTANAVTSSGLPSARVDIPQEMPQGAIQIASYGVTTLRQSGARVHALHVREIVTNDGDATPWQLDTTRQLVAIAGEGQSRAMYATADVRTLPIVTIAQHERHVIDLYFPLPSTISGERSLPRFDVLWSVDTAQRTVSSRTTFDRVDVDQYAYAPSYGYGYGYGSSYYAGWGPYTWYDPLWPSGVVFVHSPHVHFADHGHVYVGHYGGGYHAYGGGAHVAGGAHASSGGGHHH